MSDDTGREVVVSAGTAARVAALETAFNAVRGQLAAIARTIADEASVPAAYEYVRTKPAKGDEPALMIFRAPGKPALVRTVPDVAILPAAGSL